MNPLLRKNKISSLFQYHSIPVFQYSSIPIFQYSQPKADPPSADNIPKDNSNAKE